MKLEVGNLVFSVETVVRDPTPEEREVADLNREATRHKQAKDWDAAIACLRRARQLVDQHGLRQSAETALRLPLFLQQGGFFDAAMIEFRRLLGEAEVIAGYGLDHQPSFFRVGYTHHVRGLIYDKMRVACKREKRPVEADEHEAARDACREKFERYQRMMELHRERQRKRYERKAASRSVIRPD